MTKNAARRKVLMKTLGSLQVRTLRREVHARADDDSFARPSVTGRRWPAIAVAMGGRFGKQVNDAFIAETARTHGLTLVTADQRLAKTAQEFGISIELLKASPESGGADRS